jgi:hypothetical protein
MHSAIGIVAISRLQTKLLVIRLSHVKYLARQNLPETISLGYGTTETHSPSADFTLGHPTRKSSQEIPTRSDDLDLKSIQTASPYLQLGGD